MSSTKVVHVNVTLYKLRENMFRNYSGPNRSRNIACLIGHRKR